VSTAEDYVFQCFTDMCNTCKYVRGMAGTCRKIVILSGARNDYEGESSVELLREGHAVWVASQLRIATIKAKTKVE
jgi:hypothetical protein